MTAVHLTGPPGPATGGGGGGGTVNALSGISTTAHYSSLANQITGNASGFVISASWRQRHRVGAATEEAICGIVNPFSSGTGGFYLGMNTQYHRFGIRQASDGALIQNFGAPVTDRTLGRLHHMTGLFNGTTFVLYLDGFASFTLTPAGGYQVASPSRVFHIGRTDNAGSGMWPATGLDILGVGYAELAVPTVSDVEDHALSCLSAADFVNSGIDFDHVWKPSSEPVGAAPATLVDVATNGATRINLTRAGAPTIVEVSNLQ